MIVANIFNNVSGKLIRVSLKMNALPISSGIKGAITTMSIKILFCLPHVEFRRSAVKV